MEPDDPRPGPDLSRDLGAERLLGVVGGHLQEPGGRGAGVLLPRREAAGQEGEVARHLGEQVGSVRRGSP